MSVYLPHEIMLQILHKLPIKSLLRCTCVSTFWNSLIKSPSFITTHLTQTISSNTHLLLFRLCSEKSEHYSLHSDNQQLSLYMHLDLPFKPSNPYFHVKGSCNGIICLVDKIHKSFIILYNPLIKKSLCLPEPSVTLLTHDVYKVSIGFGFDSKTNDYKVLRIVHPRFSYENEEETFIKVELYSLNTNNWKSMTCIAPEYEFNEHNMHALTVNGVVHWIAFKRMRNGKFRNVVLGFDMGDEVFREINLPESLVDVIPMNLSFRKYGDSSIAIIWCDSGDSHIWVMKEYGVVGSWTWILSSEAEEGQEEGRFPMVLGFRESGEVLFQMYGGEIFSCDPLKGEVMDLGVGQQAGYSFVDGYVESLVLLDNAYAVSDTIEVIVDESDDSVDAIDSVGAIDSMEEID